MEMSVNVCIEWIPIVIAICIKSIGVHTANLIRIKSALTDSNSNSNRWMLSSSSLWWWWWKGDGQTIDIEFV